MSKLTIVRSHERMTYKRCPKKWYWHWRRGLVPREITFGALDLGTWMHHALADWYAPGYKRNGELAEHFSIAAQLAIESARRAGAPEHIIDKADELAVLGESMAGAYQMFYGKDSGIYVVRAEIPLEFSMGNDAIHRLKPDLVFIDQYGWVWLMEHKTAATIRTEHLAIDDQARPYGAMAERALRRAGIITDQPFKGIMYNFLRKALPDERDTNAQGQALNKDGSISKRQPKPLFVRHPVRLTSKARLTALRRIKGETLLLTTLTAALRERRIDPTDLPKTPHNSCPKTCEYFRMCVAEEEGTDIRDMERRMYTRRDPYAYEEDTTEDPLSFEMG